MKIQVNITKSLRRRRLKAAHIHNQKDSGIFLVQISSGPNSPQRMVHHSRAIALVDYSLLARVAVAEPHRMCPTNVCVLHKWKQVEAPSLKLVKTKLDVLISSSCAMPFTLVLRCP